MSSFSELSKCVYVCVLGVSVGVAHTVGRFLRCPGWLKLSGFHTHTHTWQALTGSQIFSTPFPVLLRAEMYSLCGLNNKTWPQVWSLNIYEVCYIRSHGALSYYRPAVSLSIGQMISEWIRNVRNTLHLKSNLDSFQKQCVHVWDCAL